VTRRNGQVLVKVDADRGELELSAPLLIGADGTDSLTRRLLGVEIDELDYQQSAVVTTVRPERAHNDTAFERFTPQGALAALPLSEGRCNLVVIASHAEVESLAALGDERFCADISQRFGGRLGRLSEPGRHHTYALRRTKAKAVHGERFVLLGNAAQTVHPNAAQGLNLGLRQVAVLAEELVAAHRAGTDLGDATTLSAFAACSAADRERVLQFTHGLGAFFYNNFAPAIALRGSAMLMLDMIPAFKRHVIEVFAGLSKPQPKLVQGLPL
jgi:2-octaprenyl-6-methoxyphenol hydroxylase